MLTYTPGESVVHRLDARSKLAFQLGFATAAFAHPTPTWLAGLAAVAALGLALARLSPVRVLREYWFVFVLLLSSPVVASVSLSSPWVVPSRAVDPLLAVSRVGLILFVSAVYVHTTPVRETRAAIQRHVPGKTGRLLGVGVALTLRFVPVLTRDLQSVRDAIRARGGENRSVVDRGRRLGTVGLSRALERADRLSVALRARCFSWNPTPPQMAFSGGDYVVLAGGVGLGIAGVVPVVAGVVG
ncbi:energy-coupling factor transporter transmembrane component T family protein [Haloarchaeobius sp. DT45]|uniref:energy-coupling factor transporter transmembrane component T family protein n=1 Tax=Haloarchaeobius sp. DT45 TaxID=3446116 RepID=UPI003F6BFE2A